MTHARYGTIYYFFKTQIEFGYYQTGDFLPTMEEVRKVSHYAMNTVRNAYLQLQGEGYISLSSGRKTLVVFNSSPEECYHREQDYYLARREALHQLFQVLPTFFLPILREGCRRLRTRDIHMIGRVASSYQGDNFYVSYLCARQMLLTLKNRLVLDLYDAISRFYQFPHRLHNHMAREDLRTKLKHLSEDAATACARDDRDGLYQVYVQLQNLMDETLQIFTELSAQERPVPEQIPFRWHVHRARPQVFYSLASNLTGRILLNHEYGIGSFLPTYGELAESYSVGHSTVRRAIGLMERFGLVTTIHGIGTKVTPITAESIHLTEKESQQFMTIFLEAIQILRLNFDGFVEPFSEKPPYRVERCISTLRAFQDGEASFAPFFICMGFLLYDNDNHPLKEIWDELYEFLILGLPFLVLQAQNEPFAAQLESYLNPLIESLEVSNARQFKVTLHKLLMLVSSVAEEAANELFGSTTRAETDTTYLINE